MTSVTQLDNGTPAGFDFAPFVRHALLYSDECVVETAAEMAQAYADELRRKLPGPVDLTWLTDAERERLLDDRVEAQAAFQAELLELKRGLDRLPAEIALARKKAGRKSAPVAAPKRRRQTTTALRSQVAELYDRGLVLAAIADTLNVSDRRVRELLRDAGYRRNGHGKRLVQATKSAETLAGQVA